jgi:hypothetical protein
MFELDPCAELLASYARDPRRFWPSPPYIGDSSLEPMPNAQTEQKWAKYLVDPRSLWPSATTSHAPVKAPKKANDDPWELEDWD